jgi:hypothetical protein
MTNSADNADGVVPAGVVPPDLGPEASSGFQSQARTASRPYTRPKHRVTTMDGGGFATFKTDAERSPYVSNLRPTDETNT